MRAELCLGICRFYVRGCFWLVFQYSSWSGDIRTSFKAVLVDLLSSSTGRKQETVKVQERFVVKPAEDRYQCRCCAVAELDEIPSGTIQIRLLLLL